MAVTLAVSFATAVLCSGATTAAAPATTATTKAAKPAAMKMAKAMAAPMNPQMGTWKLNERKSKLVPGMGKNTTVVYTAEKNGNIKVSVMGVDASGKPTHGVWVGKFDGKTYAAKGNMSWDSASYKMVNDRTNEITTMKGGKVVWTGEITVAKDGKSRTVTVNGTDAKGKKFKGKAVYDKA